MAPTPTSAWGIRDLIMPTVNNLCAIHDIVMDVWWLAATDCLLVHARSRNGQLSHNATLLTRMEMENGSRGWPSLVHQRLALAVDAVKAQTSDGFAEEYDEIMKAQDLMEG